MQLVDFLNGRSIANLQSLQWQWAPATRRSSSKQELLRLLRQQMLSPGRVRERFEDLGATGQEFLRGLLRLEGYEGDADFVAHRLPDGPPGPKGLRDLLEDLAHRGFVHFERAKTWTRGDAFRASVPQELGDVLAEALNLDTREPALMLSLGRFLDQLSPRERADITGADLPLEQLVEPAAIARRIAGLPSPAIGRAVRVALDDYAGVLPLERFPSLGLDIESVDGRGWRTALERALLGTFGHLSLLELGLGDDHECLVLYHEVVRACAEGQGRADAPIDHVYACGIDFLTDLATTVDFARATPSKLTGAGRFFKGARTQLRPRTALHSTFFMDEDSLLSFKLTVARELGLVELRADERLHATRASIDWESLPVAQQAASVLEVMLGFGETAAPRPHFQGLADAARTLVLGMDSGRWVPTQAFYAAVVARYLAELLERQGQPREQAQAAGGPPWGYPRVSHSLGSVAEAAREPLLRALNYAGLLDIGRGGEQAFVRAAPFAPILLGEQPSPEAGRLLIVNPDFEVVLFPEEGHIPLLHRLCAFCDREKTEITLHLRISQDSVQRAVLRGLAPDTMIATLRDHCRVPLSQNIEYSIRHWAESIYPAAIETLHVLELPSPQVLDAALQLPEIAPLVLRRLSPTAVALKTHQLDPDAEEALKQLGVHLA